MSNQKSLDGLLRFLDYLKDKGLLKANTAVSRKAAAQKILSTLSVEEQADVTVLDLDHVMVRFANLQGQNYTPDSLTAYKSRLKSTLDDFDAYLKNPVTFRPQLQSRSRSHRMEAAAKTDAKTKSTRDDLVREVADGSDSHQSMTLPIPIRADLVVKVHGLPFDLTAGEANKIAAVIKAMAISE